MKHVSVDSIYNQILLLSAAEKQHLHTRMQKELREEKIVAYSTAGEPLTQANYIAKLEKAMAQADRGELLTDEELQREINTW